MAHRINYEFRWKNFHGFRDTGWIEIRPLTVLLGRNNSGKTSLTAPFLLMMQTMLSDESTSGLVTRGPMIDVGRYEDLIYNHQTGRELFFGLRFHLHDMEKKLDAVGGYQPGAIELTFDKGGRNSPAPQLKRYEIFDIFLRRYLSFTRSSEKTFRYSGFRAKQLSTLDLRALREARPVNFLFSSTNILNRREAISRKSDEARNTPEFSKQFSDVLTVVTSTYSDVRSFLDWLSYIGPLRDKLKRYYEVPGERPMSIGSRGESAPFVLRARRNIRSEVSRWAREFMLGNSIEIDEHFEDVFSIMVRGDNRTVDCNIADIGFGASQVFPLMVQAAASDSRNTVTIAEQPEIHLNPRLQRVLADLFVSMATKGQHLIIETHSEHFVLSLRRLIADKAIEAKDVAIYFVEKKDGQSSVRSIPISVLGHVKKEDWPEGFFEDSLDESLRLAKAQIKAKSDTKRQSGRKGK